MGASGKRLQKARHTTGQRVLDHTHGNLKAVQQLLGHWDGSAPGRNRTCDLALRRRALYPLSYRRRTRSLASPDQSQPARLNEV